jgi:hydroxyacylglutathione hydrolase
MNRQLADAEHNGVKPKVIVLKVSYQFIKNFNYMVVDPPSGKAVIVDPAWEIEKIDQALLDEEATLSGILVTHSHPDHVNLAEPLAEKYGCPVWMSKEEIADSGFNARHLVGIDATPWSVGEMIIEPMLTPGHTPGCVCYRIGDNLFSGDVLFTEGCGMCPDVPAAHAMFASLEKLKIRLKPYTRIFPGHSYGELPGRMLSELRKDNIYLQFSDKDSFASFRLRRGQSVEKMFSFS